MTHLYLVRHGETDWNAQRRIQGSTDIPLNDTGREQARSTGRRLAVRGWDLIVASPLSRAFETATIIAEQYAARHAGLPGSVLEADGPSPAPRTPEQMPALMERRYGKAEGLDHRTLARRFPPGTPVPGREMRDEVAARVIPALERLAAGHPGDRIVVVTHGGVIRSVLNRVVPDGENAGIPIANGSVHTFRFTDKRLELVAFDDPLSPDSPETPQSPDAPRSPDAPESFDEQNPLAAREDATTAS